MHEGDSRREALMTSRRVPEASEWHHRVALWAALVAAVTALVVATASAHAAESGGTTLPGAAGCQKVKLGDRVLELGDCGPDVKTLNWVLKAQPYGEGVSLGRDFDNLTQSAVSELQSEAGLSKSGVFDNRSRRALKKDMRSNVASWYGPGFFGNRTACGKKLNKDTVGVAHKRLPCGTKVTFFAHGNWLRTKVIDRGPYVKGRKWDLTQAAAEALDVEVTEKVRAAPIR